MTLIYKFLPSGDFLAGDTESGVTGYASKGSIWCKAAESQPLKMAHVIILAEEEERAIMDSNPAIPSLSGNMDFDTNNWKLLED